MTGVFDFVGNVTLSWARFASLDALVTHAPHTLCTPTSSPFGAEKPGLRAKFARSNASLARPTPLPFAAPSAILSSRAAKPVLLGLLL